MGKLEENIMKEASDKTLIRYVKLYYLDEKPGMPTEIQNVYQNKRKK